VLKDKLIKLISFVFHLSNILSKTNGIQVTALNLSLQSSYARQAIAKFLWNNNKFISKHCRFLVLVE